MNRKFRMLRLGLPVFVLGLLLMPELLNRTTASAQNNTTKLPISAYLSLLGPGAVTSWLDPASGNLLAMDAYGKRNTFFGLNVGTTVAGQVTIKPRGDGTQDVNVSIHTSDAICWGFNSFGQPAFGYSPLAVHNGLGSASLGDALTKISYNQPAGPLALPVNIDNISTAMMCHGELRFGSGFADGTPGLAQTTQTGLFNTGVPGGCPPEQDADCFPAEKVQFKPTGN